MSPSMVIRINKDPVTFEVRGGGGDNEDGCLLGWGACASSSVDG
jgi:hypothetical protein